jgi:hypothetical protein
MSNRVLEYVQRGLVASLAVVLALAVWVAFRGIIETAPGDDAGTTINASGTTPPDVTTTTLAGTAEVGTPGQTTTTTAAPQVFTPPWHEGTCNDPVPTVDEEQTVLKIFYTCGTPDAPTGQTFVYRRVPATNRVLTNTFRQLVKGPNNTEIERGYGTFFDGVVDIDTVSLREGRAVIDFAGLESIAGVFTTQEAVQFFLANLGANAFQFSSVQAVEYRSDGNCTDFWEILGGSSCEVTSRSQWLASVEPNR